MLISDDFIFAHLPKTGGVFLQSVIKAHFPVMQEWAGNHSHHSIEFLPEEHRHKPIFAILRNPWDWYLSWFTYCLEHGNNQEFLQNYVAGEQAFKHTITRLLRPSHSDPDITEFMATQNIGLFEMHRFHILDLECTCYDISYGKLEDLAADFLDFLNNKKIAAPGGLSAALHGRPKNTTRHGARSDYYDEGLANLVAMKERRIIRTCNYLF